MLNCLEQLTMEQLNKYMDSFVKKFPPITETQTRITPTRNAKNPNNNAAKDEFQIQEDILPIKTNCTKNSSQDAFRLFF